MSLFPNVTEDVMIELVDLAEQQNSQKPKDLKLEF